MVINAMDSSIYSRLLLGMLYFPTLSLWSIQANDARGKCHRYEWELSIQFRYSPWGFGTQAFLSVIPTLSREHTYAPLHDTPTEMMRIPLGWSPKDYLIICVLFLLARPLTWTGFYYLCNRVRTNIQTYKKAATPDWQPNPQIISRDGRRIALHPCSIHPSQYKLSGFCPNLIVLHYDYWPFYSMLHSMCQVSCQRQLVG